MDINLTKEAETKLNLIQGGDISIGLKKDGDINLNTNEPDLNIISVKDGDIKLALEGISKLMSLTDIAIEDLENNQVLKYNILTNKWENAFVEHNNLTNLEWSKSNHSIDTDIDFNNNQAKNLIIEEVNDLPEPATEGQIIKLTTNKRLYLGV